MHKRRTIFTVCLLSVLIISYAFAQDGGLNIPAFSLGAGARANAVGGAFTAIADDASAIHWNPGGMPFMVSRQLMLHYTGLMSSASTLYIAYVHPLSRENTIGVSFHRISISDIVSYDIGEKSRGLYGFGLNVISAALSYKLPGNIGAGAVMKVINQTIDTTTANIIEADAGIMYRPIETVQFGIDFQNILPSEMMMIQTPEQIPINMRFGVALRLLESKFTLSYDIERHMAHGGEIPIKHHMGIGYTISEYFKLYGGYNDGFITGGMSLGFRNVDFYSAIMQNNIGQNFQASIVLSFSVFSDDNDEALSYFQRAVQNYELQEWDDAINSFDEYLSINPNDQIAKNMRERADIARRSGNYVTADRQELAAALYDDAYKLFMDEKPGRAIKILTNAARIDPNNEDITSLMRQAKEKVRPQVERLIKEGRRKYSHGLFKDALSISEDALQLDPSHKDAQRLHRDCEKALGDELEKILIAERAEALYEDGVKSFKEENWVQARDSLRESLVLAREGRIRDAWVSQAKQLLKDAEEEVVRLASEQKRYDLAQSIVEVAKSFIEREDYAKAAGKLKEAIETYPPHKEANELLSEIHDKVDVLIEEGRDDVVNQRYGSAKEKFTEALAIQPNNIVAQQYLNRIKSKIEQHVKNLLKQAEQDYKEENYKNALMAFREVLKLDPNNKQAAEGVAECESQLADEIHEKYNSAMAHLDEKKPDNFNPETAIELFHQILNEYDSEYQPAIEGLALAERLNLEKSALKEFNQHYKTGEELFQNRDYDNALREFKIALDSDPNNSKAHKIQSYINQCEERLQEIKLDERVTSLIYEAMNLAQNNDFDTAYQRLDEAERIKPGNSTVLKIHEHIKRMEDARLNYSLEKAREAWEDGNCKATSQYAQEALTANPDSDDAQELLNRARSCIQKIVQQNKQKADTAFRDGRYDQALSLYVAILSNQPDNAEVQDLQYLTQRCRELFKKGEIAENNQKWADAVQYARQIINLNPNDRNAKALMDTAIKKAQRQKQDLLNEMRTAKNKEDWIVVENLAKTLLQIDPDLREAEELQRTASKKIDAMAARLYTSGKSAYEAGGLANYKKALSYYNDVLDLRDPYKDVRTLRKRSIDKINQIKSKNQSQNKKRVKAHLDKGIEYYRQEDLCNAIAEWKRALTLDPNNEQAQRYKARAEYRLKQTGTTCR